MGGLNFFLGGSISKVIFSAGSVLTNGTSINSNAGRFADLVKFCKTITSNQLNPTIVCKSELQQCLVLLFINFKFLVSACCKVCHYFASLVPFLMSFSI